MECPPASALPGAISIRVGLDDSAGFRPHSGAPDCGVGEEKALIPGETVNCRGLLPIEGVMIGAIGDFEIFKRLAYFFETGERMPEPAWESRIENFKKHARAAAELYGEKYGLIRMRKIVAYYLKDMPNASSTRNKFCQIGTIREMDALLADALKSPQFD